MKLTGYRCDAISNACNVSQFNAKLIITDASETMSSFDHQIVI